MIFSLTTPLSALVPNYLSYFRAKDVIEVVLGCMPATKEELFIVEARKLFPPLATSPLF